MRWTLSFLVLAAPRLAAADEPAPRRFGDRGQLVITADRLVPLFSYTTQTVSTTRGGSAMKVTDTGTSFAFFVGREPMLAAVHTIPRLAADFTVSRGVTVGTSLAFAFGVAGTHTEERSVSGEPTTSRDTRAPRATIFGFAPRVGYIVPLGPRLALWPRAGIAFYSVKTTSEQTNNAGVTPTTTDTDTIFSLDLEPQLVWLPLPHVLVHVGPLVNVPLSGSHATSFSQAGDAKGRSDDLSLFHVGLEAGLGAWFDL